MFKLFKAAAAAATLSLAAVSAHAATIEGELTFAGFITGATDYSPAGELDVVEGFSATVVDTDDFAGVIVSPFDVDFDAPGTLFSLSNGVDFVASAFTVITDGAFTALGSLVGGGFDDTVATVDFASTDLLPGVLEVFTASVSVSDAAPAPVPLPAAGFLLVGALGGLAAAGRRKAKKA